MSCNKDDLQSFSVKYEVEVYFQSNIKIEWTTADGGLSGGSLSSSDFIQNGDKWTYTFTETEGEEILFTATTSSGGTPLKINLYINGERKQSAECNNGVKAVIRYTL